MKKNITKSIRIKKETSVSETTTLVTQSSSPPLRFKITPVVSEDNNNFFDDKNIDNFYKLDNDILKKQGNGEIQLKEYVNNWFIKANEDRQYIFNRPMQELQS